MLTEDLVKTIFMNCTHKDPNGVYADEVDIMEFAKKVDAVVTERAIKKERSECIKLVKTLNTQVAQALEEHRRISDRCM
jgi:hypothetical protein